MRPELRQAMDISFGRAPVANLASPTERTNPANAESVVRFEKNVVEDLAMQMLVAIRDKNDAALKSLASDRMNGWRDALPKFALEMREHFSQMTGKPFSMVLGESLVEGDLATVKCTGPMELNGVYLVLFFTKTSEGWKNCWLRNSPATTPLTQHLEDFKKEIQKQKSDSSHGGSK
jgi:hypothetical protein